MGKKSAPPPPDLGPYATAMQQSAEMANQTAQQQLEWSRQQDTMNREILNRTLDTQLPIMQEQAQNARTDRQRYEQTYLPLEQNLVNEFQNYDTAGRRDLARGQAIADVNTQFDATRRNALQRLEGFGVDPSQTRNAALDLGVRTQQAASQAAAATAATQRTQDTGRALRAEAINIGRGLPSQVAGSYGQSIQAGQAGVGGANATSQTSGNLMGNPAQWAGVGQQGMQGAAGIQNMGYANQMQQFQANQASSPWAGIGAGIGLGAQFLKDGGTAKSQRMAIMYDSGGPVDTGPSDGSGIDDQVPAKLSVGEFVIPADVVHAKGHEFFNKLLEKYHTPAAKQRQAARA